MLTDLTDNIIEKVIEETPSMIKGLLGKDLLGIILYGSCARGDFNENSDIDIALLTSCNRQQAAKYDRSLAEIATQFAMKYFAVVNFVCLPQEEFEEKKSWYPYFKSIDREGIRIYG